MWWLIIYVYVVRTNEDAWPENENDFFSRLRLKLTAEKRSLVSALESTERINFELTLACFFAGKYGKSHSTKKKEKIVLRVVFRSFTKMARRTWHWKHTFCLLISAFREGNEERSRLDKATDSLLPWLEQIPQMEQSVPNIPQGVRKCLAREWSLNWVASTFEIAIEKRKSYRPSGDTFYFQTVWPHRGYHRIALCLNDVFWTFGCGLDFLTCKGRNLRL